MKTPLPESYSERATTLEDLEDVVALINAASRKLIGVDEVTVEQYRTEWGTPGFNLESDSRVVLDPRGQIVGYMEVWDLLDLPARITSWGRTHPEHVGLGIGSYLLDWAEERARKAIERAPEGARVSLHAYINHLDRAAAELLHAKGFKMIRHYLRMVIELNGAPPVPNWPEGITVRTMRPGEDVRDIIRVDREAFKDHFNFVETPFEEDLERWLHWINNDEKFDPQLWFLALYGDQIVGVSLCLPRIDDDPQMGWVESLGVLRPYRRRGIAQALLQHSFGEFYRRGKPRVGLGVDASSLTGATRLYEKAGMRPDPQHQHDLFEKELRPGVELSRRTLDDQASLVVAG